MINISILSTQLHIPIIKFNFSDRASFPYNRTTYFNIKSFPRNNFSNKTCVSLFDAIRKEGFASKRVYTRAIRSFHVRKTICFSPFPALSRRCIPIGRQFFAWMTGIFSAEGHIPDAPRSANDRDETKLYYMVDISRVKIDFFFLSFPARCL